MAQLSEKVAKDMKLPALDHGTGAVNNPNTGTVGAKNQKMDLRTAMLYAKALDAKDSGDQAKAAQLFRQVLDKFPDYTPAKTNLAKVTKSGE